MDDSMTAGLLAGTLAVLPVLAVLLLRRHIPFVRRLVAFNPVPPFRGWAARPHPDAAVPVEAAYRLKVVDAGDDAAACATVVVRTAWGGYTSRGEGPGLRTARPLTPVVYVDGTPASWGWGTTKLTLPPGRHLIAVATSHTRCYQQVDLERGEKRELDHVSVIGANAHQYHEGHPGLEIGTYLRPRRRSLGETFATVVKAFRGEPPVLAEAPQDPATAVRILDHDEPESMVPAPGWAGLGLHLGFWLAAHTDQDLEALGGRKPSLMQRWRIIRIGEPVVPACRPWVPAPQLYIDGREVEASWTRMWLQLPPGEHEVVVRVAAPSTQIGPQTAVDLSRAERRQRVFLAAGETKNLALTADVTAVPRADRPELATYRVRL